jgi:hypothetical protein
MHRISIAVHFVVLIRLAQLQVQHDGKRRRYDKLLHALRGLRSGCSIAGPCRCDQSLVPMHWYSELQHEFWNLYDEEQHSLSQVHEALGINVVAHEDHRISICQAQRQCEFWRALLYGHTLELLEACQKSDRVQRAEDQAGTDSG